MILNNTKNLISSFVVPKKIQILAKSIQFFSSNLAMSFADKLFKKPLKFKTPGREKTMWESAQKKRIKVESLQKEIDVLSYGFSIKKVLLVHGWAGRSTQLFMIADKLLEKGFMVVSFDATAHGKSEGEYSSLPEFIEVAKQVNTDFGPFVSAVGHSLGGMVLYNVANELKLKSFVTIGAANKISGIMRRFVKGLDLKPKVSVKLKNHYDKIFKTDVDKYSSLINAKEVKMPVLVVHDSLDGDVPVSCAQNIRHNLENGSLLITEGLGHTKILRDKKTMSRVVNFINNGKRN